MKVVRDDLPTEGVHIGGVHFKPGIAETVDAELGKVLVERKGFTGLVIEKGYKAIPTKEITPKEKKED